MPNITEFDQRANDRCRSIWRCHSCDINSEARFSDLAEVGTPICAECGEDMEIMTVVIEKEKSNV